MNRRMLSMLTAAICMVSVPLMAQESESTTVTTSSSGSDYDFFGPFMIEDATPLAPGQLDLRLRYEFTTGLNDRIGGDNDDDHGIGAKLVWGTCDNVEVSIDLPVNLGDSGDADGGLDGNGDVSIGFLYRFYEGDGNASPDMAFATTLRIPTGDNSSGVDGEFRLLISNEYDSGVRSHINGFATTVNGNNDEELRDFQWGVILGMDGPLCADGAVRWVADFMHSSSVHDGVNNLNILELGTEWVADDNCKLGLSTQIGLDHNGDTPDFGVQMNWSYTLMR